MQAENISVEDLFTGKHPHLTASMEAIRRGLFERIGRVAADAKKRIGEATGADQRFFNELKERHSHLADAIKNISGHGNSVEFNCYALDSKDDAASLIKAAGNASAFYGNFNKSYQKISEGYLDKAADFAVEINQILTANSREPVEFIVESIGRAWLGATIGVTIFWMLFTGPFVIFLIPMAALMALPMGLLVGIIYGLIGIPLGGLRTKGLRHPDVEKVLDLMARSRKNYEGWRDQMKHLVPGNMPGQAGFEIEGGKAEFDYHRKKQSLSIQLTQTDVKKLHQIAGDILHNHRAPSDFRLNTSPAVERLDKEVKRTQNMSRGTVASNTRPHTSVLDRYGSFQEKDVSSGQTMIPVQISRYMAELADSLLDAVETATK
jgi:uncharacterized lipoprotein YehR (DUF1307 family)